MEEDDDLVAGSKVGGFKLEIVVYVTWDGDSISFCC